MPVSDTTTVPRAGSDAGSVNVPAASPASVTVTLASGRSLTRLPSWSAGSSEITDGLVWSVPTNRPSAVKVACVCPPFTTYNLHRPSLGTTCPSAKPPPNDPLQQYPSVRL